MTHFHTHMHVCTQRARLAAAQAEGRELRGRVEASAAEHEERVTELLETLQAVSVFVDLACVVWVVRVCVAVRLHTTLTKPPKPNQRTQVERAFEQAKAEHEQEQAQRQKAHEEAYRSAVEKREGRLALLKARKICI